MESIVRESMSRVEDARSLIEAIFKTEADWIPDEENEPLKVRLHQPANWSSGEALQLLCSEFNAILAQLPGANMRLLPELVS